MKKISLLLSFLGLSFAILASEQTMIFEENNPAWTYSGYWRDSSQGQHGSDRNYAVGNGSETKINSYTGESGVGSAQLDLSGFSDFSVQLEVCYVSHGNTYRDSQNTLTITTDSGDSDFTFSQLGQNNVQICFDAGIHTGVNSLSLSNATPANKWVTLDYVRLTRGEITPPPAADDYQSIYTPNDIVPTTTLGISNDGELVINAEDVGIVLDSGAEFARTFAVLDDIDGNNVHELLITAEFTSPVTKAQGYGVIVFLDQNRSILKVQYLDEAMLFGTGYSLGFSERAAHKTGDFDGNGVTDIVLSENSGKSGRFRTVMFGKTDDITDPRYTVVDVLDHSNAQGNLPFVLTSGTVLGSSTQPYPDVNNNGVMGFFTQIQDVNGDLRRSLGLSDTQRYFVFVQPGSNKEDISEVIFSPASVTSGGEVVGDLNNDGIPDIMTAIGNGRDLGVFSHISQGSLAQFVPYMTQFNVDGLTFAPVNILKVGDANSDGYTDILLGGTISSGNSILVLFHLDENYQQLGEAAVLIRGSEYASGTEIRRTIRSGSVRAFDLDRDGRSEIILGNPHSASNPALHIRYFQ